MFILVCVLLVRVVFTACMCLPVLIELHVTVLFISGSVVLISLGYSHLLPQGCLFVRLFTKLFVCMWV